MDGWSVEGKRNKEENCYSMTVNELKKVPVPVVVVDKRHSQRIMDLSFERAAAMAGCRSTARWHLLWQIVAHALMSSKKANDRALE